MQIVVKNLSFSYDEKDVLSKALDGISLNIEEGDFFGIIGQTGSGKSTFVQHLNGLIKLKKGNGEINIGEFNLADKKCDFKKLRSKLGMVFQYPEYQLFAETVEEDVAFGLKNFMPELSQTEVTERVKSAIEKVGLNYPRVREKSPFELSGGQKRRVAIAGVIVVEPEILVLDEPAAGLDPKGKKDFLELLNNLHKTTVKTIIIVSHDMNLVAENCNRVAVFSKGKIIAKGSPKEIFSGGLDLKDAGLEYPLTAFLTQNLKSKGIEIESDLTVQDFVKAVSEKYRGKKK